MIILYLNNERIADKDVSGKKNISVTLRDEGEDGQDAKSYSGELTLTGRGWEIMRDEILTQVDGRLREVLIKIEDTCCEGFTIFKGKVTGEDVEWCEDNCTVTVSAKEKKPELDCIRSTVISESGRLKVNNAPTNFLNQSFPRVIYCNDPRPDVIQFFLMLFGAIFYLLLIILTPVVIVISVIIRIICAILDGLRSIGINVGECSEELKDGIFDDYKQFLKEIDDRIVGCGRKHPSPLLREYVNNLCTICGVTFKSSIYNDPDSPYYDTVWVNAPSKKGTFDDSKPFIGENVLTISGREYLDMIKQPINGKWKLRNNVLTIERKDFFQNGGIWIDFSSMQFVKNGGRLIEQCYEFSGDPIPAYGRFEYPEDPQDRAGAEAREYYNDVVEWNPNGDPVQTGEHLVQLPFSASRFRQDGIDEDVLDLKLWELPILPYRSEILASKGALFLSNGTLANPKLLIWDGADRTTARIKRYSGVGGSNGFNYPYVFEEVSGETPAIYAGDKLQMTVQKNLYHNFHQIDDPRLLMIKTRTVKIKWTYNCDELQSFAFGKLAKIKFFAGMKEVAIDQLQIDFTKKEATITGKI